MEDCQHQKIPTTPWVISSRGAAGNSTHSSSEKDRISDNDSGVLLALRNNGRHVHVPPLKRSVLIRGYCSYLKDGKVVEIDGTQLMGEAKPYFIYPGILNASSLGGKLTDRL